MKVLFIDSGIGGLTTLAECVRLMPNLSFIYYADDKYSPYGNLPAQKILWRLKTIIDSQKDDICAVVLACNTATANCIAALRKCYRFPIIGTEPAIKLADGKNNKVLLIATSATCNSPRIYNLIEKCSACVDVVNLPTLAKQIDEYFVGGNLILSDEIEMIIDYICLLAKNKTHIVLGCTHYVHLKPILEKKCSAKIVDGNLGVAKMLKSKIAGINCQNAKRKFCLSGGSSQLCKKYEKIFLETLASLPNL